MAYDVARGVMVGRDWSIEGTGTSVKSLALHTEMQSRDKVLALGKLVDVEVRNNEAVAGVKTRAGTMLRNDVERFQNFVAAWRSWKARNLTKTTSPRTIGDLERWRSENAEWTRRLTDVTPLPAAVVPTSMRGCTRPSTVSGNVAVDEVTNRIGEKIRELPWKGVALVLAALLGYKLLPSKKGK